jgi:hypothetical protein
MEKVNASRSVVDGKRRGKNRKNLEGREEEIERERWVNANGV